MQKNGLSKNLIYVFAIPVVLLGLLVYVFFFSGIETHNKKLNRLEENFTQINHPMNTKKLEHHTHIGEGPYVSGDGPDECHYYVAEIRSFVGDFNDVKQYYSSADGFLQNEFAGGWTDVVEVNSNNERLKFLDKPIDIWASAYLREKNKRVYIIYTRFSDDVDTLGDYRCWRE